MYTPAPETLMELQMLRPGCPKAKVLRERVRIRIDRANLDLPPLILAMGCRQSCVGLWELVCRLRARGCPRKYHPCFPSVHQGRVFGYSHLTQKIWLVGRAPSPRVSAACSCVPEPARTQHRASPMQEPCLSFPGSFPPG